MRLCTFDAETYYDSGYSLARLTIEEYVRAPLFELIGFSYKIDDAPAVWVHGAEAERTIRDLPWHEFMVLGQNTMFDGAILSWRYGVKPAAWMDIMAISRALHPHDKFHSLAAQLERTGLGVKGDEVLNAKGKRWADFTPEELRRYGEYCCNDTERTYDLFQHYLKAGFPQKELRLIDLTLRMFIEPKLRLNAQKLREHYTAVVEAKRQALETVVDALLRSADADLVQLVYASGFEGVRSLLMSNARFAQALEMFGVTPPMKKSPTTGKMTYAFAKTDEEFKALEEHPDPAVQALVAARLSNKTTLEETRTSRFIGMAARGPFPVPLRYYGAHSGRWAGEQLVNLQNLPSRGPLAGRIKKAIEAPPGYVVIDCDSSQIEARTLAWLAGQDDLVEAFRRREDVYKLMASKIYGIPVDEIDAAQRQVGKTVVLGCFGPDTKVLTQRGWVPIIHVQATDKVWDGQSWVTHAGVIPQGEKDVWTAHGISATSDHEILTEHGWVAWSEVLENPFLWKSALAVASSPSSSGGRTLPPEAALWGGSLYAGAAAGGRGLLTGQTCSRAEVPGATDARKRKPTKNGIGSTNQSARTTAYEPGCSTAYPAASPDATTLGRARSQPMGDAGSTCTQNGGLIEVSSCNTCSDSKGMTERSWSSTESTWTADTSLGTSGLSPAGRTYETDAPYSRCRPGSPLLKQRMPTYDIAYAGPRNRYTILSDEGPIVVHNCGYGVGWAKLQGFLKMQAGVVVDEAEARRIIDTYRSSVPQIVQMWRRSDDALRSLINGQGSQLDVRGLIRAVPGKGLTLPNGLFIQYPGLRMREDPETGKSEMVYFSKGKPVRIYGGKVVENACQAVARCIVAEQMLRVSRYYPPVLTVHDAVAIVAPESEAAAAQACLEECMRWTPKWAEGLPLACESGVGKSYGDC